MTPTSAKQEFFKMLRRNPLLMLGIAGFLGALIFSYTYGRQLPLPANQLTLPPSSPYAQNVSGIGIVEANTKNIRIGTHLQGIVDKIYVEEGSIVKKGDPLFSLDKRTIEADILLKEHEVATAKEQISVMQVALDEAKDTYDRKLSIKSGVAISIEEKKKSEFAYRRAEADKRRVESDEKRAEADLNLSKVTLEKMTVKAPTDGLILKVFAKIGEAVGEPTQGNTIMLMGNHQPLYLRVQIDENDAWRFEKNKEAIAYLKSNKDISFPLTFVRLDPYAAPKKNISGDVQEFVDTRIIEIIYKIEGDTSKIFIGQQLDVFMNTNAHTQKTSS